MTWFCLVNGSSVFAVSTISGFVTDRNGVPIAGADLDFIDVVTGIKLFTPGDNTDINGFYSVTLLNSTFYHVTFAPPAGTNLMGKRIDNFDLTTDRSLDVVLDTGTIIQGTIRDSLGTPVGDVDFDADHFSLGRIFTPDDNSDLFTGNYWAVVPAGTYRLRYDPPPGGFLRGFQIDSIQINVDTVIDITLSGGSILSGNVIDPQGNGIGDVDIDLRDVATGAKVFISKNTSDSLGRYRVVVPVGLFELRYSPASGSRFVGASIDSFAISGDITLDQTLSPGILLTTKVTDSLGLPVAKADIDVKLQSTGAKLFTPNDKTDSTGSAIVTIPKGTYIVQIDPPPGSLFDQVIVENVNMTKDTTMDFVLPEHPRVTLSGRVENVGGIGIPDVAIDLVRVSTGVKQFLAGNRTDTSGAFVTAAPVGLHNVLVSPPAGSRFLAATFDSVAINVDTVWNPIVLDSGLRVTVNVIDMFGSPIVGGDIDFIDEVTLLELFTPHDNISRQGIAGATVPPGDYTIVATPVSGSSFRSASITKVSVFSDTSFTIVLPLIKTPAKGNNFILEQNYPNPFGNSTIIRYTLLSDSDVSLTVYNLLGQEVVVLLNRFQSAGHNFEVRWDGTNRMGGPAASGVYFYRLKTSRGSQTRKLVIVR